MVFNVQRQLAMRRRGRSFGTVARRFAAVAGAGYGIASRTKRLLGSVKRVEAPAITNQFDVKTTYRRRRMPARRRKGWLKFKKRVLYATNANAAKQVLLFRNVVGNTVSAGSQSVVAAHLYCGATYGFSSYPNDMGSADLQDIWDAWRNTTAGTDNMKPGKINFTSAVLDVEFGNSGGEGYANSLTIDVYHCRCKRTPIETQDTTLTGFAGLFNAALLANTLPNMSSNNTVQLDDAQAGVTPFHAPLFCKYIEVKSVKKVLLSVGQTTHFQLRLSKDRVWNHQSLEINDTGLRGGLTEGYMFIVQGVSGPSDFSLPVKYTFNANRTYHFRVDSAYEQYGGLI